MLVYSLPAILALLLNAAGVAVAPAPAMLQAPVPSKVTLTVGGRTETLRGTGRCAHEPHAWLYGSAAALWIAEYAGETGGRHLSLSYWRFATAGEEQFSLSVNGRAAGHASARSRVEAGRLRPADFRPTALGGRLEIAARRTTAPTCRPPSNARFGGITAEGG
jgi:hypothetical protein